MPVESKHYNSVFTLFFSWQLSKNNCCQLFHVQSRKSWKLSPLCLRRFPLLYRTSTSSLPCCFEIVTPPIWLCNSMYTIDYWLIDLVIHSSLFSHKRPLNYLVTFSYPLLAFKAHCFHSLHEKVKPTLMHIDSTCDCHRCVQLLSLDCAILSLIQK